MKRKFWKWLGLPAFALPVLGLLGCSTYQKVNTAADAICVAADAWEDDSPELEKLRAMCEIKDNPLEALQEQFQSCILRSRK